MIVAWRSPARRAAASLPGAEAARWGGAGVAPPSTPRPSGSCAANLLRRGVAWQATRLRAHVSERILYRTPDGSVELCATPSSTKLRLDDGTGGVRIEYTDRDYIIPRDGFEIGGVPVVPQRGHLVYVLGRGKLMTYEVFPYNGEPCWEWHGDYYTMVRVRLKLVAEEDA